MFKIHKEELEVNGKKLTLETGKIARQADGAIIATLGETIVIATAVGAKKLIKKTVHVLFENKMKSGNRYFGRDEHFNAVIVESNDDLTGMIKKC